jgi:hypothetical protein
MLLLLSGLAGEVARDESGKGRIGRAVKGVREGMSQVGGWEGLTFRLDAESTSCCFLSSIDEAVIRCV